MATKTLAADIDADGAEKNDGGTMDDDAIVGLYMERSEAAIEATQAKYGKLCYSVAYGVLDNNEDAEECVNDALLRLWDSIPPELPDNFPGFICRIARNLALDKVKLQSAGKRSHAEAILDELDACVPAPDDTAGDVADRLALKRAFERFLASEPPPHRMIFMRRYFYLDDTRDIAKALGITDGGVRVTLYRLRRRLKKYLDNEGIKF